MRKIFRYVLILFTWAGLIQHSISSEIATDQSIVKQEESGSQISNEIIFLHTDRETYIAGDNLFFKVYLYDEVQKKLSGRSKIAYIVITNSKNRQIIQTSIVLSGGMSYGCIQLPDTLETGPCQIIAYTNWMRNFGESTFFSKQLLIANRFDANLTTNSPDLINVNESGQRSEKNSCLTISTGRGSYGQREKVTLMLSLPAGSQANVSISVAESPPEKFNKKTLAGILSTVNRSNTHSDASNPATRKKCEYLIEDKGSIITGSVHNASTPSGLVVALSTPDSMPNLLYSITDAEGRFFFQLNDFYYNKDLYLSILDQNKEREATLSLNDKYATDADHTLGSTLLSDQLKQFIKKSQTIANINKTYNIQSLLDEREPGSMIIRRNVYYKADHIVSLEDYVQLDNFAEIVREILPYLRLRKHDYGYEAEIIDPVNKIYLKNPAVFLNGMPVNNLNSIINFGSDRILRIETITRRRIYGSVSFNGILSVFTTADVENDKLISPRSLHLMPVTFQHHAQYLTPEYSSDKKRASRNPDFRQLLYWDPSYEINGIASHPVEFYTSDNKGNYMIKVEGIASDGTPVSCTAYFEVR